MRRWMFFGLWILSLAAITFYGGAVSYGFFFGVSLLPLVCLGYIACVYCRFKIYQEIGSRTMVCGRPESYLFILKNEDFFAYASVSIGSAACGGSSRGHRIRAASRRSFFL